ncbi:MAG: DUF5372 family protein [Planctomycetota bacterium]|nr:DUF5372 family protein [Planctomycetota bacterium]
MACWSGSSTAPGDALAARLFRVTHPFHPLFNREFTLVEYRCSWREYRVWFYDDDDDLRSLPAGWTSIGRADPVVEAGAGRVLFRSRDLLSLADLIREMGKKNE